MSWEIERKYLVADLSCLDQLEGVAFRQGYIPIQDGGVVRVRIEGERAVLTLKGATSGIARREYEYEIPRQDAESILATLCQRPHIEKTRYTLPWAGKVWTIDVFSGENEGLVLAEVELNSQDEAVEKPPWAGVEVSDDPRYYNANLVRNPYASCGDTAKIPGTLSCYPFKEHTQIQRRANGQGVAPIERGSPPGGSGIAPRCQGITASGLNLNGGIGGADERYGPAQGRRVHVVEQNAVWATRKSLLNLP